MCLTLVWAAATPPVPLWLCFLVGMFGGLVNVPLLASYQRDVPADARGNGMAILNTAGYLSMTLFSLLMVGLARAQILTTVGQLWFVTALAALGAGLACRTLWWPRATPTPSAKEGFQPVAGVGVPHNHRKWRNKSPE
jgi:hypothetical protein